MKFTFNLTCQEYVLVFKKYFLKKYLFFILFTFLGLVSSAIIYFGVIIQQGYGYRFKWVFIVFSGLAINVVSSCVRFNKNLKKASEKIFGSLANNTVTYYVSIKEDVLETIDIVDYSNIQIHINLLNKIIVLKDYFLIFIDKYTYIILIKNEDGVFLVKHILSKQKGKTKNLRLK